MIDLGTVKPGRTLRIPFSSFDKDDGSSITMTNFAAADILVYKDGGTTERASTAGFTATTDFDAKTGKHVAIIDLADNTTAGFFGAGSEYLVAIDAVTVDAVTTGGWLARFVIGYPEAIIDTTIATLSSQTSFTLTAGPAEDDALNDSWAIIHDIASAVQIAKVQILDYTGSTRTVTLAAGATFTVAAGDNISIMGPMPMQPATTARRPVVDSNGLIDATTVRVGPTGAATAQTARDVGASVLLSPGTGTGQLSLSSGAVLLQATQTGVTIPTVTTLTNAPSDSSGVTTLLSRLTSTRAGYLDNLSAGAVALASSLSTLQTDVTTLLGRITSTLFTGITSLAQWLGLIAGKQTGNSTARTELRATGAGSGTFDETTDSLEAQRDNAGSAGAGFTAIPWNAAWDAEVQSEAQDAINASALATAANLATAQTSLNTIAADTAAILLDTGTDGVVIAASSKTGMRLSATGVDDILDEVVLGSYTMRQLLRGIAAASVGKLSGAATTTVTIRSADDTKDVIIATVDADGNRSAITLDLT